MEGLRFGGYCGTGLWKEGLESREEGKGVRGSALRDQGFRILA